MRNSKFITSLSIVLAIFISSCSNEDDANNTAQNIADVQEVRSTVQVGNWRITNFNDSGEDETLDFDGYSFTFAEDGTLTATNGANTLTGNWSVKKDDDDDDDDSDDDIEFDIFFPVPDTSDFEDLNDDWDIVSITDTKIELIDIDDDNEPSDRLTFEKN